MSSASPPPGDDARPLSVAIRWGAPPLVLFLLVSLSRDLAGLLLWLSGGRLPTPLAHGLAGFGLTAGTLLLVGTRRGRLPSPAQLRLAVLLGAGSGALLAVVRALD